LVLWYSRNKIGPTMVVLEKKSTNALIAITITARTSFRTKTQKKIPANPSVAIR